MSAHGELRGWPIEWDGEQWIYVDSREPTIGNRRDCGSCGKGETPEGHDGCLGTLEGVTNACCGHGNPEEAYVQFSVGDGISGGEALDWIKRQGIDRSPLDQVG